MKFNQMQISIRIGLVAAMIFLLVSLSAWPAEADEKVYVSREDCLCKCSCERTNFGMECYSCQNPDYCRYDPTFGSDKPCSCVPKDQIRAEMANDQSDSLCFRDCMLGFGVGEFSCTDQSQKEKIKPPEKHRSLTVTAYDGTDLVHLPMTFWVKLEQDGQPIRDEPIQFDFSKSQDKFCLASAYAIWDQKNKKWIENRDGVNLASDSSPYSANTDENGMVIIRAFMDFGRMRLHPEIKLPCNLELHVKAAANDENTLPPLEETANVKISNSIFIRAFLYQTPSGEWVKLEDLWQKDENPLSSVIFDRIKLVLENEYVSLKEYEDKLYSGNHFIPVKSGTTLIVDTRNTESRSNPYIPPGAGIGVAIMWLDGTEGLFAVNNIEWGERCLKVCLMGDPGGDTYRLRGSDLLAIPGDMAAAPETIQWNERKLNEKTVNFLVGQGCDFVIKTVIVAGAVAISPPLAVPAALIVEIPQGISDVLEYANTVSPNARFIEFRSIASLISQQNGKMTLYTFKGSPGIVDANGKEVIAHANEAIDFTLNGTVSQPVKRNPPERAVAMLEALPPVLPIEESIAPKNITEQTANSIEIFNNWNKDSVANSPSCSPSFMISQPHYITYIDTYHWNYGSGTAAGGTISLKSDVGMKYGPWQAETKSGQGSVPNAWWIAHPNETIPAGTYTIIDSDTSTWSQNSGSNGCGFSKVEGYPTQTSVAPTPPETQVALTIYVHDENLTGPQLPGVQVTGQDALGAGFSQVTNSDGSVVINGQPGTWQFTFSKYGYEPVSLNYSVTKTQTTAGYLQRNPTQTSVAPTAPPSAVEWPTSAGGNGHYYEAVLVPGGIAWDDARAAAEAKNGHLASITSEAENNFVYNLVAGDDRYWLLNANDRKSGHGPYLGGYLPEGSSEWAWVTGEPFYYTNWAANQPDNSQGRENTLDFFGPGTLKSPRWNDVPHDFITKSYIVEWEGSYSQ